MDFAAKLGSEQASQRNTAYEGSIPEVEALGLLLNGKVDGWSSYPACIKFTLSNDRILVYWRDDREYGDAWVLEDA